MQSGTPQLASQRPRRRAALHFRAWRTLAAVRCLYTLDISLRELAAPRVPRAVLTHLSPIEICSMRLLACTMH